MTFWIDKIVQVQELKQEEKTYDRVQKILTSKVQVETKETEMGSWKTEKTQVTEFCGRCTVGIFIEEG